MIGLAHAVKLAVVVASFYVPQHGTPTPVNPPSYPITVQEDLAAAAAYWEQTPPLCISEEVAEGIPRTPDAWGEGTQPIRPAHCIMVVDAEVPEPYRCRVVVHEYGHWLGYGHSADEDSPMAPVVSLKPVIPQCEGGVS